MVNFDPDFPPDALRALHVITDRQLSSLRRAIEPLAGRRPDRRVPEQVLSDARSVLAAFQERYKVYDERKDDDVWRVAANRLLEQLEKMNNKM